MLYGKRLIDINEFLVGNWRKQQLKRDLSAGGVNRPIVSLSALLNYAYSVVKIKDHHPLAHFLTLLKAVCLEILDPIIQQIYMLYTLSAFSR